MTKTDSATLLVAMKPLYFPWLTRCILGSAAICKLPGEDVECWKAGNSCLARPLGRLYGFVELVTVECVGVPMVISLVPGVLEWWLG